METAGLGMTGVGYHYVAPNHIVRAPINWCPVPPFPSYYWPPPHPQPSSPCTQLWYPSNISSIQPPPPTTTEPALPPPLQRQETLLPSNEDCSSYNLSLAGHQRKQHPVLSLQRHLQQPPRGFEPTFPQSFFEQRQIGFVQEKQDMVQIQEPLHQYSANAVISAPKMYVAHSTKVPLSHHLYSLTPIIADSPTVII